MLKGCERIGPYPRGRGSFAALKDDKNVLKEEYVPVHEVLVILSGASLRAQSKDPLLRACSLEFHL